MKRFKHKSYILLACILVFVLVNGCAHYLRNQSLTDSKQKVLYDFSRFDQPSDADKTFIVLTFSGGGTRAAALSYGVLEKMKTVQLPGTGKSMLDEVDVISTVSGGSFTGAYYALFGDRIFSDFKDKFLNKNIQRKILLRTANPVNWFRLWSPYFSRIDLAAELYDETIFDSRTFETLAIKSKRPFLIINATNLYNGARFEFTSNQFRYLGSDILSYPIARAVAASSAFPFLLSPISLVNHPYPPENKMNQQDISALKDYWINKERYYSSYNKTIYADDKEHPYIHLMDGGLSDNLGLRAIYDLYVRADIRKKILDGNIERLLVIVVNARAAEREDFDKKESPPGLKTVGYKTCTVSMDNYSFETVEAFRTILEERLRAQGTRNSCQKLLDKHCKDGFKLDPLAGGQLKLYIAELTFENLPEKDRDEFNKMPTSFSLSEEQVNKLIDVGGRLLVENPDFKKFIDGYK